MVWKTFHIQLLLNGNPINCGTLHTRTHLSHVQYFFRHLSQTSISLRYLSFVYCSKLSQALLYIFLQFFSAESSPGVGPVVSPVIFSLLVFPNYSDEM